MVQRPFSEIDGPQPKWINNTTHHSVRDDIAFNFPSITQSKTVFHNLQRPKISTMLASVDTGKGITSYSNMKISKSETANELRMANRYTSKEYIYVTLPPPPKEVSNNISKTGNIKLAIKNYYQIPTPSRFFPPAEDHDVQNAFEQRGSSKENTVVIPDFQDIPKEKENLQVKGILIPKTKLKAQTEAPAVRKETIHSIIDIDPDNEKADFLIEGLPMDSSMFSYNLTSDPFTCSVIKEAIADIDAQEKFSQLNIEVRFAVDINNV